MIEPKTKKKKSKNKTFLRSVTIASKATQHFNPFSNFVKKKIGLTAKKRQIAIASDIEPNEKRHRTKREAMSRATSKPIKVNPTSERFRKYRSKKSQKIVDRTTPTSNGDSDKRKE